MAAERLSPGMIQVYTGEGKGKTTCAFGLALRAVGQGLKVYIIQFFKTRDTGELQVAARLAPQLTIRTFGRPGFPSLKDPAPETVAVAQEAFDLARSVITAGEHDLVILDEINLALHYRIIPMAPLLDLLRHRPGHVEVVLTGRGAPPELLENADLVTEMRPLKHYYEAGVKSRRGIEW